MEQSLNVRVHLGLLGLLLLAMAAVVAISIASARKVISEGDAIRSWPQARGIIVESEVVASGGRYWPKVAYTFRVGGKTYRGTRIRIDPERYGYLRGSRSADWPRQQLAKYKVGAEVPVFYEPEQPAVSVLEIRNMNLLQAYPTWGLLATFVLLTLAMRQVLVLAPFWVFASVLVSLLVLWTAFLIAMRPAADTSSQTSGQIN